MPPLSSVHPLPQTSPRTVTVLGSTGSIGCQTLDLIARNRDAYQVVALSANRNVRLLAEQAREFRPSVAVIADETQYAALKEALAGTGITAAAGAKAIEDAAAMDSSWVMAAIMGAAGLPSTLAAARRGATIAFANKETLVCAGSLMMEAVAKHSATLLPVDSEHNAIFQVFDEKQRSHIRRLILTASGGPFRTTPRDVMAKATPAEAIKHPVWSMGAKISIDSATLMNKALEVIEAHFLFTMPSEQIDVIIHPQSVIHSMVEYADGSVLAQMGTPDMRTPIGYCLAWPERMETPSARLDFAKVAQLTFEDPDLTRFPALTMARQAMAWGGTAPAVLSAANEIAVAAFLDQRIGFLAIEKINETILSTMGGHPLKDLATLAAIDAEARTKAAEIIQTLS